MIRYPGGKHKLAKTICAKLTEVLGSETLPYREPFFGGGAVGTTFLKANPQIKEVWVNDRDCALAALWLSVMNHPEPLKAKVREFTPSIAHFYEFKDELLRRPLVSDKDEEQLVGYGFKKLAVHQMSYSGLGVKSGGPIGGKTQESKYKVDCRWVPDYICKKIDALNALFAAREVAVSPMDFMALIEAPGCCLLYLDPPYYIKGNELYQYSFTVDDHKRLAEALKTTNHRWVLSYDDCPQVQELYSWAHCEPIGVNYTIRTARRKGELLITAKA